MTAGTVLVAGALGIIGRATMAQFAAQGRDIVGLSRREPPPGLPGRFVAVDLTDAAQTRARVGALRDISHVVYTALFEKPELRQGWLEADQIAVNTAMFRNLLDAVQAGSPALRHITLLQGAKAYGVHLGQITVPARESAPRHLHPNFYWQQEDILRARRAHASWRWTIFRPQVVLGFAPGSAMNMLAAIGAYAAISRARGLPLIYPGIGTRITEATDVGLLARAIAWAGDAPAAADEIFNITNGDVFAWPNVWPAIARHFGMEVGLPHPMSLAAIMPAQAETWNAIVGRHDLLAPGLDALVGGAWQFADFAFSRTHSTASLLSTIKIRTAGFGDCIDTEASLLGELRKLQAARILPP